MRIASAAAAPTTRCSNPQRTHVPQQTKALQISIAAVVPSALLSSAAGSLHNGAPIIKPFIFHSVSACLRGNQPTIFSYCNHLSRYRSSSPLDRKHSSRNSNSGERKCEPSGSSDLFFTRVFRSEYHLGSMIELSDHIMDLLYLRRESTYTQRCCLPLFSVEGDDRPTTQRHQRQDAPTPTHVPRSRLSTSLSRSVVPSALLSSAAGSLHNGAPIIKPFIFHSVSACLRGKHHPTKLFATAIYRDID